MFKQKKRDNHVALSPERKKELQLFEKHAGIRFRELEFLNQAFTHRSYANELGENGGEQRAPRVPRRLGARPRRGGVPVRDAAGPAGGELARIKSFVVSEASLSEIARGLRVDNFILIGKGEEYSGGRSKKTILADCLEAIIGAYYLDSGFAAAERFVHDMLIPEINKVLENRHAKDYKTLLQEHVQKRMKTYPRYRVVQKTGPDHDKTFWIEVHVGDRSFGAGKGKNKKEAEQEAARLAWENMTGGDKAPRPEKRRARAPRGPAVPRVENRPPRRR